MKKVLFPFEIDREAYKEAYISAVTLARNLKAELILLNAFYIEADNRITRSMYMQLIRNNWFKAYKEIHFFNDYYLRYYASMEPELRLKMDHRFVHGNLVDEFRIIVNRENIDVVVLPATDENESTRRKIKLMRHETLEMNLTSLLITPPETFYKQIQNVLIVYSKKEQNTLFDRVNEIVQNTKISNATIHLVQLSKHGVPGLDQDQEPLRSITKEIQKRNQVEFHKLQDRNQRKEIMGLISDFDLQLLVLSKGQLHSLGNYFHRHIIEEISSISKIPILILKDKEP
jgi:hypothetical protein